MRTKSTVSKCSFAGGVAGALLLLAAVSGSAQTVQYTYDADSRLIAANYSTKNALMYVFDPAGNLVQFVSSNAPGPAHLAVTLPARNAPAFKAVSLSQISDHAVTLSFSWSAVPGSQYRLQFTEDLSAPWQDVPGNIVATGATAETVYTDSSRSKQHFFRIILLP